MMHEINCNKLIFLYLKTRRCKYCIMQIVRGGKVSRLHNLLVIRGKTFTIVQQFETPYNKKEKFVENLRNWRLIRKNRKSFPPRTIYIIQYYTLNIMHIKLHRLPYSAKL